MSRVLLLGNSDVVIYNFRLEIVEQLLIAGHEVFISSPYGRRIDDLIRLGCRYEKTKISRHGKNPFEDIRLLHSYKDLLRRIKPDIVFTYTIKPNIYGGIACAQMRIPYVVNITGLGTAVEQKGILQVITTTLYCQALRKAQKVFFQNQENMAFMVDRGIVKQRYELLPGSGVNLNHYQPLPYPSGETVDFVFVARVMKEKGIDQYLDAAKYIRNKYPYTRFHICGAYEQDYASVVETLQQKGVVIYHGQVGDMIPIYRMASCTVHPTYYPEGMSNVLLESCASARPIITTDRSGCREIVEDGVNGFVCKQQDSENLIKQIERFLALPCEKRRVMGLAGREKVEKEFDRRIVVNAYLRELKK